jgi:plasmid stability protein
MLTKPDFPEICTPLPDDRSPSPAPVISMIAMAQLIVRDIDKALVDLLKRRAVANGRSAEAEHREILRAALQPRPAASLKAHLLAMPAGGDDADFAIKRTPGRRVKL